MNQNQEPKMLSEVLGGFPKLQVSRALEEQAKKAIIDQMNLMKEDGRLILMTDEEERLIRSFRRFKMNAKKSGEVFKWQTAPSDPGSVIVTEDSGLVKDPQEV